MKLSHWAWAWAILSKATAALPADAKDEAAKEGGHSVTVAAASAGEIESTTFNGIEVPPMLELDADNFAAKTKSGYWWVKHYSPYCSHCKLVAPVWQTLYEFYQTSSPLQGMTKSSTPDLDSPNSFHGYYNFHFASLNCIAYGDLCDKHQVGSWPTFILFKDGQPIEIYKGGRTVADFSTYVEEKLEQIKPGSRPKDGVAIPKVGAKSVDPASKPETPLKGQDAGNHRDGSKTDDAPLAYETAKLPPKKPFHKGPVPNAQGASVPLTGETFHRLVTNSPDSWFIKFYAPWCAHCQHLAPTWQQMSRELKGKLNVGEVNCDAEPQLCKDANVHAYPTIYYFRNGERVEFEGLRGLGDLVSFAEKALDSDVKYVTTGQFVELEKTEDVIFTYFFDHATTSEDFAALDRLTLSLIGHAKIVKTDSQKLAARFKIHTWPRLLVSRDGRPTYYTALAPSDMRDFRQVLSWMQSVWLPIVPELTASNAREIMDGNYAVLGVLSRDRADSFGECKRELKTAALEWMDKMTVQFQLERQEMRDTKQLRIEESEDRNDQRALRQAKSRVISINERNFRKPVRFAWVDGVFWDRWLRSTYGVDIAHGERVIIADQDNHRYWDVTETGNYIIPSRTSILETLPRVVHSPPKLAPKSTIGRIEGFFFQIRNMGAQHPYLSGSVLIAAVGLLLYLLTHNISIRRNSNGFFRLDEKNNHLGGTSGTNGKAD